MTKSAYVKKTPISDEMSLPPPPKIFYYALSVVNKA